MPSEIPSYENIDEIKNGKTLYVGGSGPNNYTHIQDAIDDASDGDIIFVYSGIYYENIVINRSISLIRENKEKTVIDGGEKENTITIRKSSFIHDFIIRGSGDACAGIDIKSEYVVIEENIITNNDYPIYISNINHTAVLDNIISNNTVNKKPLVYMEEEANKEINKAGQIILIRCNNITIRNQEISNTFFAIYLMYTNDSYIYQNSIIACRAGIILYKSNGNCIFHNNISESEKEAIGFQFSNRHYYRKQYLSYSNIITFNNFMKNSFQALLLYLPAL